MKMIPNAVSSRMARQALMASKNSPTLLLGVGVVGMIGSTVLACRATLKLEEVLAEAESDVQVAENMQDTRYSDDDRAKDIITIKVRTLANIGKLYVPAVGLGVVSVGCLIKSNDIQNKRVAALTAAYAAIDHAFREYRERVVEKYGEEEDLKLRYSSEVREIKNDEGKTVKALRVSDDAASMYARFFDQLNPNWSKEAEWNLLFLRNQQNYCNDLLKARGHVFLNEVYALLGIDHSQAGSVVGWVISKGDGDNYIDFGLYDDNGAVRDFVNGREGSVLLDFNVDGVIYDKIEEHKRGEVAWQK